MFIEFAMMTLNIMTLQLSAAKNYSIVLFVIKSLKVIILQIFVQIGLKILCFNDFQKWNAQIAVFLRSGR
jgi:hypothetical protein